MIELKQVSKRFGDLIVLDGVNFAVNKGETVALLGPSGTGKSVLLKHINGLIHPDRGEVLVDGLNVNRLPRKELARLRARIGYVFQGGALFDSMDVYENLAFPFREYAAAPEAELPQKVRELLAKVGLSGIEDKDPADLSGGMRKRVALARALALEPEVLLFDEPTTGLDPVTSDAIGKLILTTRRETGCAAVTVTHDLALARRISDRIAFLHEGKFRFVGSFEEAERSGDRELAAFLAGREEAADVA